MEDKEVIDSSTSLPMIPVTQKEVNEGTANPLLHAPSQILTKAYDGKITLAHFNLKYDQVTTDTTYIVQGHDDNLMNTQLS